MDSLLNLPLEFQIVLVSGYLAYKIFVTGRGPNHSTEDTVLQILSFGSLGRLASLTLGLAYSATLPNFVLQSSQAQTVAVAVTTACAASAAAVIWRKWGLAAASDLMSALGVYRDDHEYSTWASIQNASAIWTFMQVHVSDGRILESHFGGLPESLPTDKVILNADGIALYITKTYDKDGKEHKYDAAGNDGDFPVTYLPRDSIVQVEIGLRKEAN